MARTEAGVRTVIIDAITTSAMLATLGLKNDESILDRRLEQYIPSDRTAKITGRLVTGQKRIRSWAVQVVSNEEPRTQATNLRNYTITVVAYYEPDDINTMIDHSRKIKEAIRDLSPNISETVGAMETATTSDPELVETPDDDIGKYVTMEMTYTAFDACPEY